MKVSVIVPAYNTADYISKCLDSVLLQTYQDLEVIVINDGSSDKTADIVASYAERHRFIKLINKNNEGVVKARNDGLRRASGNFVLFLDSDDYLTSNALQTLVTLAVANQSDLVISNIAEVFGSLTLEKKVVREDGVIIAEDWLKHILTYQTDHSLQGKLYRRSVIENVSIPPLKIGEDMLFNITIIMQKSGIKIFQTDFVSYCYLSRTNSAMTSKNNYKEEFFLLKKSVIDLFSNEQKEEFKLYLAAFSIYNMVSHLRRINSFRLNDRMVIDEMKANEIGMPLITYKVYNILAKSYLISPFTGDIYRFIYKLSNRIRNRIRHTFYG